MYQEPGRKHKSFNILLIVLRRLPHPAETFTIALEIDFVLFVAAISCVAEL